MKRALLVHGWGGSPEEGWRPWLRKELEKKGFDVTVPAMPDTNHPKMAAWVNQLSKAVGKPDKNCYFVGHSLGCITILRYLETIRTEVGGVVFVGGFSDNKITVGESESVNEIKSFFETDVDWKKIRSVCSKFVAIHSDNDPYIPLRYGDIFRKNLGAEVIIKHDMKHFSGDDGIYELPPALEAILKISK